MEHLANVNRPDHRTRVGLTDQPSGNPQDIACLTAEITIGGVKAYALFDSGSNTDSLTPEFAKSTLCKIFALKEQITLQLGCTGSKSRINFGSQVPIDFGGLKGYLYFDIVNLDRYDCVLGTPFMIKHGIVLDFGKREVRFPNGHVIPGLSALDNLSLVKEREAHASRPITSRK
ncbi:hypothetical protein B0H11DRAFT_1756678 [Mycena galericulata]|nr:hypothetical protein B0H11DRAFT_1756678 [Mycena galericulata]